MIFMFSIMVKSILFGNDIVDPFQAGCIYLKYFIYKMKSCGQILWFPYYITLVFVSLGFTPTDFLVPEVAPSKRPLLTSPAGEF